MNFSGILIGVLTFFLIGLFHPIVIYAEYYFGSRCWPVFLLVGILCMILSVRMQEILWSVSLGVLGVSCFWSIKELKEQEKLDIIEHEYNIPISQEFREDVSIMCNLSQGIKEQAYVEGTENGIAIGKQEGIAETIIKMSRKGYEAEQISDILDMTAEEVREIIENE